MFFLSTLNILLMNNGNHHLDTLHSENSLEPNSISQGVRLQVKDVHGTLDFELNFASFLFLDPPTAEVGPMVSFVHMFIRGFRSIFQV